MGNTAADLGDVPRLAYLWLKERILSGDFAPGEAVKIQEVADAVGASAVPVREAIRMLASEGLMELRPRRSPVVAPLALRELLEIITIRQALEPFLLRLATPRHTPNTVAACRALIERDQASRSFMEKFELNRAFHLALIEPAGQPRALKIVNDQFETTARFAQMAVMRDSGDWRGRPHLEHADVLEHVAAGEAEEAARLLAEHVQAAARRIECLLSGQTGGRGAGPDASAGVSARNPE